MSRRKTDEPLAEDVQGDSPEDGLTEVVRQWLYFLAQHTPTLAEELLVAELRAAGLHTPADLAKAPIAVVAAAIRAAWQTDAHSLTGLAAQYVEGAKHEHPQA